MPMGETTASRAEETMKQGVKMKSEEIKKLVAKSENAAVEFKRAKGGVFMFSRGVAEARSGDGVADHIGGGDVA